MKHLEDANLSNPFPGLRPFEMDEYHLFFGRDGQSDELLKRLRLNRFLAVVGTSGSGKSSLIRAGLLPALYGGLMAGAGSAWRVVLIRPGHDPIGNLAHKLGQRGVLAKNNPDSDIKDTLIETTLRRSTLGLVDALRQDRTLSGENLLVVVDQFEELFRFREASDQTKATDDAAQFVKLLIAASAQEEIPIYVVITMRSDFLGDCSQFAGLPEAINQAQYLIPRMTRDERQAAITGPIVVGGAQMTLPLVNRLLNDVGDNPDQLPILQHALMRTWNHWADHRRNGDSIGLDDYEAIGTMAQALSKHADEACSELKTERNRFIAEKLFKCLTEKGEDNREIRRPTQVADICNVADATLAEVAKVVNVFRIKGRSFLMPPEEVELTGDSIIDISHESLIRNWDVLKSWTAEEAESGRMYRRLADALKDFGGSPLPNSLLDAALDWQERNKPTAAWAERYRRSSADEPSFEQVISFIDSSQVARETRIEEERRRVEEEATRQRRELENAAALADKERRLAENERQRAEERALDNQRQLEQAQIFAKHQEKSARRLKVLLAAMVLLVILASGAAVVATKAQAAAAKSKQEAEVAFASAEQARKEAEKLRGIAEGNAKQEKEAKEAAQKAEGELKKALVVAKAAENLALAKEAEAVALRNKEAKARLANEHFRDAFTESNILQASKQFQKAGKEFEELEDFVAAGASYLQSANVWTNNPFETPNDEQIKTGHAEAIRSFKRIRDPKEARKREAKALVAKGEYLTGNSSFSADSVTPESFMQGISSLEAALRLYEDNDDLDGRINTLRTIGSLWKQKKEAQKAIASYEKTIPLYEKKEDWAELTKLLLDLATEDETNRPKYLNQVLDISEKQGDLATRVQMLTRLADFYLDHQKKDADVKTAIGLYDKALDVYKLAPTDKDRADLLNTIGAKLRFSPNETAQSSSVDYYKRSLDIYLRLKDRVSVGSIMDSFVANPEILQRWPQGLVYMEEFGELLDGKEKGSFLMSVAFTQERLGQPAKAIDAHQRAVQIFTGLGELQQVAAVHMLIGKLQNELKDHTSALESFRRAQEVYHGLNKSKVNEDPDYSTEADALSAMATEQEALGQLREAIDSLTKARDLYKKGPFGEFSLPDIETRIQNLQKQLQKP